MRKTAGWRLPHWPITSLDHTMLSATQLKTCCGPLCGMLLQQSVQPLTGTLHDWPNLFWLQSWDWFKTETPLSHVDICIYHFITPTHFCSTMWLLPLIYTGESLIDGSVKGQYTTETCAKFQCVCRIDSGVYLRRIFAFLRIQLPGISIDHHILW